jgi:hypothetical protein
MRGTLSEGDALWGMVVPFESLQVGDVVAFQSGGQVLVHRIVGREGEAFRTQGDGNWRRDAVRLLPDALVGKVTGRERNGRLASVVGGARGRRRARFCHAVAFCRWLLLIGLAPVYRVLRASRLVSRLWHPRICVVRFAARTGPVTKYIHKNKTVARWNLGESRWTCRKPFDLVLSPPRP